jgi:hypothetical protein
LPKIPLLKSIEATKLHPKTGTSLGIPDVTISYGALIEPAGSDRDRQRFTYLGELYACKRETFLSATGGAKVEPKGDPKVDPTPSFAPEPAAPSAGAPASPEPAPSREPRLEWQLLNSSDYAMARARVPGGWLITVHGDSLTFVPDPGHRWDGGSPK